MDNQIIRNKLYAILYEDCNGYITANDEGVYPTITETTNFPRLKKYSTRKKLKVFKRTKHALLFWFGVVALLIYLWIFGLPKNGENNNTIAIIIYTAILTITGNVLWNYNNPTVNFILYIDAEGIQINDEQLFLWDDIASTAIISKPIGLNGLHKLVVLLKNDTHFTYDLTNFSSKNGINLAISNCIEFYKHQHQEQKNKE